MGWSSDTMHPHTMPIIVVAGEVLLPGATLRVPITTPSNLVLMRQFLMKTGSPVSTVLGVMSYVPQNPTDKLNDWTRLTDQDSPSSIGTAAEVVQLSGTNWPQPSYTLLLSGTCRFRLEKMEQHTPFPVGRVHLLPKTVPTDNAELNELIATTKTKVAAMLDLLDPSAPSTARLKRLLATVSDHDLADLCASVVRASPEEKLQVLRALDLVDRYQKTLSLLRRQIEGLPAVKRGRPRNAFDDAMIVSRYPSFRRMPGGGGDLNADNDMDSDDISELEEKLKNANLPDHAQKVATRDLKRLKKMMSHLPEYAVTRSYLELMSELPWSKSSDQTLNINKARVDLDADHYAMEKVKKRVLEYLAVRQLRNSLRGPILCFVGPPGVGKTSIGRSIANTLGREFHRISLGGVCDQSDIRGHRRTYVAAFPGRIIQGLRTVSVNNPVFLLDEIDKLSAGLHGDPAAALLEVLDPEQNCTYTDHYLNVAFDLSQVLFIATANSVRSIPPALLDRMEVIPVSGYTEEEKLHIAIRHLIPKQLNEHGLDDKTLCITNDSLKFIISRYTREAGVRSLERKIGALCRAVAVIVAEGRTPEVTTTDAAAPEVAESGTALVATVEPTAPVAHMPIVLDENAVEDLLGMPPFDHEMSGHSDQPGVAVGLAWTSLGGEIMYVEATKVDGGTGQLVLTGQLGSVMRESAKLALNWVRTHHHDYGIAAEKTGDLMENLDIHIHFPAGAQGKDGPSAGVTIVTVLISLFLGRCVSHSVAMTGEITLRGLVLPVGGIKEKILAAHRAGISKVILPFRNEKDVNEIPATVQRDMTFIYVKHIDDVLQAAFDGGFPEARLDVDDIIPSNL